MPDFDAVLPASTPLARQWAEEAMQDELRALIQFAFLRRPLAELLRACVETSLDVVVLKGAALAETVYPRPSLRWFGDIDILVRSDDIARAHALLAGLGYTVEASAWVDLTEGRDCEANFFKDAGRGPVVVELHTDLLNNGLFRSQVHLDQAGLWGRAVPVCLAGMDARVLGPEDQLLHLCLHLASHYFTASNSLRDIAQVCAVQPVDWPLFVSLCRKADAAAIGYGGLFAAMSLLGASVPTEVLEVLAPRRRRPLLERLVTTRVQDRKNSGAEAQRFLLVWLLLDTAGARRRAIRHLIFPTRAWLHTHYYHDIFDPPDTLPPRRTVPPGLRRRLPVGLLLYGAHLGFLARKLFRLRSE